MYSKIEITGIINIETGLHIGTSNAFSAIGAVDSPVVRDTLDRLPMIPGSSLKGKMRTLLARQYNEKPARSADDDDDRLLRIFGSAKKGSEYKVGRLLFSDMVLINADELRQRGVDSLTEVKFENTINRLTAEANPRQIERVIRGSKFRLCLIYEINEQKDTEVIEDVELIGNGLRLLQYDYLGGSGSRGYGKITFSALEIKPVVGNPSDTLVKKINELLSKVGDNDGI